MKKLYLFLSILLFSFSFVSCNQTSTDTVTNDTTEIPTTNIDVDTEFTLFEMAKYHSIGVTPNNEVYGWGNNQYGQLGELSNSSSQIINLTKYFDLSSNEDIIDIALGDFHSSILTTEGQLYIWGKNGEGQIGDGTTTNRYIPVEISSYFSLNEGERITDVESGAGNMLVLTTEFRVFSWGYNEFGQVGIGPTNSVSIQPVDITESLNLLMNEEVLKMSIGYHHCGILTSNGRLISWGYNNLGQLGNGTTNDVYLPTDHTAYISLRDSEIITDIEFGYYHSAALTSENRVFIWGLNENGQIGNGTKENLLFPIDITGNFNLVEDDHISSLSLGGWMSSAISNHGQVFMWGCNGQGRLAMSDFKDFLSPTNVFSQFNLFENEVIVDVILGGWSSSAITSYGRLFTWGRNNTFQLGHNLNKERNPEPTEIIIN